MTTTNPTTCDRCGKNLDGAYSQRGAIQGKEWIVKETICLGCDKLERIEQYQATGRLSMKLILSASFWRKDFEYLHGWDGKPPPAWMQTPDRAGQRAEIADYLTRERKHESTYREIVAASDALHEAVKVWEQEVWFAGLQRYYRDAKGRGHKAALGDLEMLVWGCAGRVMVTLNRGNSSVTVLCDETSPEPRSGLHSIDATHEEGMAILLDAASNGSALLAALRPDNKVGML